MVKFLFEIEPPLHWNLVCSTEMLRINIKTATATMLLVSSTWKRIIREDLIGLVTWMKRKTYMTSLTCAGSAMVGIFNKGQLRKNSCYMHELFSVSRRKIANCCYINIIVIYQNMLTLQWKSTLFFNIPRRVDPMHGKEGVLFISFYIVNRKGNIPKFNITPYGENVILYMR